MIVCICKSVTAEDIERYLELHPTANFHDVIKMTSAGRDCGICVSAIIQIINDRPELLNNA
jgi:bacterioferritin-associated ferredoxin